MATELPCPKCHAPMRTYERNGIQIDQCSECRGIYLDRGELERLIDAESAYTQAAPQPSVADTNLRVRNEGVYYDKPRYGGHHGRRKSFLSELFD